jgi:hypothetical protein
MELIYTFLNISQTNNNLIDNNWLFTRGGWIWFLPRLEIPLAPFSVGQLWNRATWEKRGRQEPIAVMLITRKRHWLGLVVHTGEIFVNGIIIGYRNYNYY